MKKLFLAFFCICLALLTVSCGKKTQPPQENNAVYEQAYSDVISQYTALITASCKFEELPKPNTEGMDEREAEIANSLYAIAENFTLSIESGYGYKDLDGNGIPELMLMTKYAYIYAVFTLSNDKPILLKASTDGLGVFALTQNNRFYTSYTTKDGNIQDATYYICRVDGDKVVYDSVYGQVWDSSKGEIHENYQIVDGERIPIDRDAYKSLNTELEPAQQPGYYVSKLLAPRIHRPLADNQSTEGLPRADFSDYSAIRETYRAISDCVDEFSIFEWTAGDYDNLFAFSSDREYDYYNKLFYATHFGGSNVGYDEIDINGDGQDELVFLNEYYQIKAIFTKKNGTPVMLDAFGHEICWLDGKGFIHVDNEALDRADYMLYEFTKEGNYKHVYTVFLSKYGDRYLIKDGKYELITFEKSLEYFDELSCYSEPFEANEYTRNVFDLTYTPLDETTDDLVMNSVDKTWVKYAKLEKDDDALTTQSGTVVTFENATNKKIDVKFKYTVYFLKPDPDKEGRYLEDTVESELKTTARAKKGVFVFDEGGVSGKIEFGQKCMWIIIEESTDQRFPKGAHCYSIKK